MGRFYKTSKPEMIDFMFKLPEQAMMTAIKGMDAQLEGQESYLTDLQKQLKVAALDPDKERRDTRVRELEKKISDHSLKIWENPLAAIKEQKGIRDLGQEIYKDLTEGELYAYNTNAAARQEYYKKAVDDATGKDGRLNIEQVNNAMKAFDLQYEFKQGAQFNKSTGKFNPYGTDLLYDYMDNSEYAKKTAENWEDKETESWKKTLQGAYWKTEMEKSEILGIDELTMGILNTMMNDEKVIQPLIQGIQHQAQIKAIQEIKRTGSGNYDELYDQYFDKLYQQEFGEIDPATKQLALKPVIDPATKKQAIDPNTGKPMTELKNPGNLYRIAYAAADKKDKYNITTKEDYDADPFALQARGKELELANAIALENYKQPVVLDRLTGQFIETTFEGQTVEEAETGLNNQMNALNNSVIDYKTNLIKVLLNGVPADQHEQIRKEFDAFFPTGVKPNFNGLNTYLTTGRFMGNKNLTGVKDFQNQWESTYNNYENKKGMLEEMKKQTLENLPDFEKIIYTTNQNIIKQKEQALAKATNPITKLTLTTEINSLKQQNNNFVSKNLNLNPTVKGNRNMTSFGTYQTTGDLFKDLGVAPEKVARVKKALDGAKQQSIFSLFGGASGEGTFIRNGEGTAMIPLKGTTIGDLFLSPDKYNYTYNNETGEFEASTKSDNTLVFKGNVGNYYVAVDDLDKVGKNTIATTISGSQIDPKTGKRENVTFDLYSNQLKSSDIQSALNDVGDELELLAFQRKAERAIDQTKSSTYSYRNNSGRVRYSKSPQGVGIYEFYDDNGNRIPGIEAKNSAQVLALWKTYK